MEGVIVILVMLGLLFVFTGRVKAAQKAQFKCLINPCQVAAMSIRTKWDVTVRWRASAYSFGPQYQKDFVVRSDGCFERLFAKPPKGFILQGTIIIHGGWAYHDSILTIIWNCSSREPELIAGKNSEILSNGQHRDTARYGAVFNMKRK